MIYLALSSKVPGREGELLWCSYTHALEGAGRGYIHEKDAVTGGRSFDMVPDWGYLAEQALADYRKERGGEPGNATKRFTLPGWPVCHVDLWSSHCDDEAIGFIIYPDWDGEPDVCRVLAQGYLEISSGIGYVQPDTGIPRDLTDATIG